MDTVREVVEYGLCTGCGTCAGVCPTDAIAMCVSDGLFVPVIDESLCTKCRTCVACCPGFDLDMSQLCSQVFEKQPDDSSVGVFVGCYVGYSNDERVRSGSASGGIVSELLVYALEKGLIDGAVVARMKENRPLEPEPFIARTREEILSASKSKYCPVPTAEVLKRISGEKGRFAIAGLPCHLHGVRKAESQIESLKGKIVLHVGLFCSHTASFLGTGSLLRRYGIAEGDVERLDYRGCGWPGFMSVQMKGGHSRKIRFSRAWDAYWNVFSPFFFTPERCSTCPDLFNELSDVSVGDAWLPELLGDGSGQSVVVSRTVAADGMLHSMRDCSAISLRQISPEKVKESQAFSLNFKKSNLSGRISVFRAFGRNTPTLNPKPGPSGFVGLLGAFLCRASLCVSASERLRSLLACVPLPLFRLYFGLFKCVSMLSM